MTAPTIGRVVHYTLTEADAARINKRRDDFTNYRLNQESYQDTGYVAHFGNRAEAGQVFPLVITRIWHEQGVNGQVLLDGADNLWVTSVNRGPDRGQWEWPVIISSPV